MKPKIATYRYGTSRRPQEGIRIGATRHVPRGVRKEDWQRGNYFDVWLPVLGPSADLLSQYRKKKISFATFGRRYERQMKAAESRQVIELLTATSFFQPISVGCYCEDESICHRSILKKLLLEEARVKAPGFSHLSKAIFPGKH